MRAALVVLFVVGIIGNPYTGTSLAPAVSAQGTGKMSVHWSNRHLARPDGTPFFWLGDTAWWITRDMTFDEAEYYFETRVAQGFTLVQMAAVAWNADAPNAYGQLPFFNNDLRQPSEAYWRTVDRILDHAEHEGLAVGFLPIFIGYEGYAFRWLTIETAYEYGRFLGQRYGYRPNIIWILGGDDPPETPEEIRVWDLLAAGIEEGAGGNTALFNRTVMTLHPSGASGGQSSARWVHNKPWLDFNMIQTWDRIDRVYPMVLADYQRTPTKPAGLGEGVYEDESGFPYGFVPNPKQIRHQAYLSFFAGGYHTYGARGFIQPPYDWNDLQTEGIRQLGIARSILERHGWFDLIPDSSAFLWTSGDVWQMNAAMRSPGGNKWLVYLSSPTTAILDIWRIGHATSVTWIDPRSGAESPGGILSADGAVTTPPGWQDAILVLTALRSDTTAD